MSMKFSKLFLGFIIGVYAFILLPIIMTVIVSFNSGGTLSFPIEGFTLSYYIDLFNSSSFIREGINSLKIALLSTILALLVGVPAAYSMCKYKSKFNNKIKSLFLSPVLVPGIVLSFALFNYLVLFFRLKGFPALVLGHMIVLFPYTIRIVSSSLDNFDFALEEAALSLGANNITIFSRILLPNISSAILSASILSFITSFNNVPISLFLTDRRSMTLPIKMMNYVEYYYDPTVAAVSVILILITVFLMIFIEKVLGLNNYGR